jgi:hypothetical protein
MIKDQAVLDEVYAYLSNRAQFKWRKNPGSIRGFYRKVCSGKFIPEKYTRASNIEAS